MVYLKNGLGNARYKEAAIVAEDLNKLKLEQEISYTYEQFLDEQLYDTIIEGLEILGCARTHAAGKIKWYGNDQCEFVVDFRNDVIIIRRIR